MNLKLYSPYQKQKEVHKVCADKSTFFITVNSGRQSGKSLLAMNQALMWSLSKKNMIVYWISPTSGQASKVYKQLLKAILGTPVVESYKGTMGDTEIIFKNGSTIKLRSAAQEDSLRGESIDYLILDESAFIKESTFQEILLPMLNVRGKKCLSLSTPKGKNFFYTQFMKGRGNNPKYVSFKFTSADNPHSNLEIIAMAKASLPKDLFDQEYLAEFVDSAAVFKNVNELATMKLITEPKPGDKYWAGIDIALKGDYTVITIMNQDYEVVYYERFNNVTAPILKERLVKTINLFKPEKTMIELNNQGLPIYDDLKDLHKIKNIIGFNTTSSSKPEIINNLINAFGESKLRIPDDEVYKDEIKIFTMTLSKIGRAQYSAPSGFNDDIPMSLAITWECINKYRYNNTIAFT